MFALILMNFLQLASPEGFREPLVTISPGAAESNMNYWDRPIRVCGRAETHFPNQFVLFRSGGYLLVELPSNSPPSTGEVCVTGVVQRSDGCTVREAIARGMPFEATGHGLNASVVLRPCRNDVGCAQIARGRSCGFNR